MSKKFLVKLSVNPLFYVMKHLFQVEVTIVKAVIQNLLALTGTNNR